ncbi:ESSS subunit of NADH:ubiquinone oxidoreductase [Phanerochaete sordida]|uniref:NADH dehydrogenase [ubiquinone] 1 beta subcomplex subunit 11, mitochondrial n=1 Tax=Phanerochaete sordida TaxID=48140 RepID=A0A9P3G4A8_9APHY|nr:ESSS subunit of NADH:ubiquinone oxidoreductase [Phanerochaete sordida]
MPSTSLLRAVPKRAVSRSLSAGGRRYASHGHGPQYNEPSGFLFGEKPLPPGQKRKKEDWENMWYAGMYGTFALAAVLLYYKPDTSVQAWAIQEAKARMEARGEKTEYP